MDVLEQLGFLEEELRYHEALELLSKAPQWVRLAALAMVRALVEVWHSEGKAAQKE